MPTSTYFLEFRDGTSLPITPSQADVVDKAWAGRSPVKLGDITINTVDLKGIWPSDVWFDQHPDQRPPQEPKNTTVSAFGLLLSGKESEEPKELSDTGKLWFEAMRRNIKELKEHKKYGNWAVESGELIQVDEDIVGQRPCKNHTHPVRATKDNSVKGHKVIKQYSEREFNKLSQIPGYRIVNETMNELEYIEVDHGSVG